MEPLNFLVIIITVLVGTITWVTLSFASWLARAKRTMKMPLVSAVASLSGIATLIAAGVTRQGPLIVEVVGFLTLVGFLVFVVSAFTALEQTVSLDFPEQPDC